MSTFEITLPGVPSESVREVDNHDGAVLLDIQNKICMFMTPIELQVWRLVALRRTIDQIVDDLRTDFQGTPPEVIKRDVIQFVSGLQQTGLLKTQTARSSPVRHDATEWLRFLVRGLVQRINSLLPTTQKWLICRAFSGLLLFDLFQLRRDFKRIENLVRNWSIAECSPLLDGLEKVCDAMNLTCVWYPKYVACAQRSAVLTCLLRSSGIHAEMVIGAQTLPFKAHAWTEVNGSPVNERRSLRNLLVWQRW